MAYIQGGVGSFGTLSVTLSSKIGNGNGFVGAVVSSGPSGTLTVTDDQSNIYTQLDTVVNSGTFTTFYKLNITNGPQTISFSYSTSNGTQPQIGGDEYSLLKALDVHTMATQGFPGAGTDAITSGNVTATDADWVWGVVVNVQTGDDGEVAGSSFTLREQDVTNIHWGWTQEDRKLTSAQSVAATFTDSAGASNTYITAVVTFTPAAAVVAAAAVDTLGLQVFKISPPRYF